MMECSKHYSEGTDDGNESAFSIHRKWPLSTYAHAYCHGTQNLENLNLHINLCHFWIILTTYKWSNELAAQNYIFTPFGGLFVTMYTTNHGPFKFLIKIQEEKNTSINSI